MPKLADLNLNMVISLLYENCVLVGGGGMDSEARKLAKSDFNV